MEMQSSEMRLSRLICLGVRCSFSLLLLRSGSFPAYLVGCFCELMCAGGHLPHYLDFAFMVPCGENHAGCNCRRGPVRRRSNCHAAGAARSQDPFVRPSAIP